MRDDSLARALDEYRWPQPVAAVDPSEFPTHGYPSVAGRDVTDRYGVLAHFTDTPGLLGMARSGRIGFTTGCWLTPTAYAACLAPYNLGLGSPRDLCLLVNVDGLDLYGPGTSLPSGRFPGIWQGGGVAFWSAVPIDFARVRQVIEVAPCGDPHR